MNAPPGLFVCLVDFPVGREFVGCADTDAPIVAVDPGDEPTRALVLARLRERAAAAFPNTRWRIAEYGPRG